MHRNNPSPPSLKRSLSGESNGSQVSRTSSTLLFGEIPLTPASADSRSNRSNSSICNLVLSTSSSFLRFWLSDSCRDAFLSQVPQKDLLNLRLVCHDFGTRAAPYLFEDVSVTFRPSTFTKPARMAALDRIGRHVKTLTFNMHHGAQTFLPPLIDPVTGEERPFIYEPQVQTPPTLLGKVRQPKYGSWEMTDLLIKQYPPLFHSATNIPAFIRAFSALRSLAHLKINCPGQEPAQRYRRSTVDYALISLRIAIERSPLKELNTLTFLSIHPAGLLYLQPMLGLGSTPGSSKRWNQIRKLAIHMDSFPFDQPSRTEHLRILHTYLRTLSPCLSRLFFRWKGDRGPSPLSLDREPCLQPPRSTDPSLPQAHGPRPLRFPRLRYMELENALMDSSQISTFISCHRRTLAEFNFEDVTLRSGSWDDALAPLTHITGNDDWKRRAEEVMDVPLILSPVNIEPRIMGPLMEQQEEERSRGQLTLSRWLSRSRSSTAAKKTKEQFWGGSEHMRKFLRSSVFAWR
ncbi:hypothetical protein K432DRAFT_377219 [Lepidopterella palustris CBS 459.81]|uniref:Uncharacterized protein n=1 Tax=Lepidopterella palustris CBS 459.81 TaxID=1314670 RepID=A0A8E2JKK3_9PEZI|nr:hypothetical protein K432DRAFT_377219 [Lepidopterella palustris CBS 459.81]